MTITPIVAAFRTAGLSASDTPAGPLVACPVCDHNMTVKAKAVICLDCQFSAVGDPWDIAAEAKRAVPHKFEEKKEEEFPFQIMGDETFNNPPDLPEELIPGLLARGNKLVIGGSSKSNKTWSLMHLALALSTGTEWWGYKIPRRFKVLYLNLEIQAPYFIDRINKLKAAMGIEGDTGMEVINLRGMCDDHSRLLPALSRFLEQKKREQYDAIFLDPLYKMLHGSESDQEFMAGLVDSIERFGDRYNAATVYAAHFAKGDQWQKSFMDRIAGSGVVVRDADAIFCVTKLPEGDDTFQFDVKLRNFPHVCSVGLRWVYPFMRHDPAVCVRTEQNGGQPEQQPGRPAKKMSIPSPQTVADIVRQAGGTVSANKETLSGLCGLIRREIPGTTKAEAIEAIDQALGVTIEYTGEKSRKVNYILK